MAHQHNKLTFTDRILADILLPFIPRFITPNMVTWFRFFTIPFVVYLLIGHDYFPALFLFAVSAFSDAVDGSLARTRNKVTEWGKTFDPLADKILIGSSAFIIVSRFLGPYLAATIIILELALIIGAYYRKRARGIPVQAEISGKIKMVLQSLGIVSILLAVSFQLPAFLAIAAYLLYISIIFAILSLVVYKSI